METHEKFEILRMAISIENTKYLPDILKTYDVLKNLIEKDTNPIA